MAGGKATCLCTFVCMSRGNLFFLWLHVSVSMCHYACVHTSRTLCVMMMLCVSVHRHSRMHFVLGLGLSLEWQGPRCYLELRQNSLSFSLSFSLWDYCLCHAVSLSKNISYISPSNSFIFARVVDRYFTK